MSARICKEDGGKSRRRNRSIDSDLQQGRGMSRRNRHIGSKHCSNLCIHGLGAGRDMDSNLPLWLALGSKAGHMHCAAACIWHGVGPG